ncbi:ATP synthase (E/31 kDa) subunit [Chlamydia ibidis]|uniref:ATP synthase (E/31 kDa) subunit n=2 Tax=Chlamydia ibidis TaxID=1405396 RepID=S7J310_9CHLA|nr:V-type ATP synthase subunit E [Chlamydia ibidis]EPP34613.1 ATP synthase (E/31 kDa) subunit [Chlamydia ibidis]EQM62341.1 ATP synthase (E/31 kDa) subunit [Chlamydia ibidis 10-1398/6]
MADLNSDGKLKQICDALRLETLKPAEEEADIIVRNAHEQAKRILQDAQHRADKIIEAAQETAEARVKQGESALAQAGRRALESLKQAVEQKIFREALAEWLEQVSTEPDVASKLITSLVHSIEEQGVLGNMSAFVGKYVPARKVNELLGKSVIAKLKDKGVTVGKFVGGVQLRVEDKNWILDLSSDALLDLLMRYLQRDFREMIFQAS